METLAATEVKGLNSLEGALVKDLVGVNCGGDCGDSSKKDFGCYQHTFFKLKSFCPATQQSRSTAHPAVASVSF